MWDLPGPGLEPMSPVLAGGFLTTAPPGTSANMEVDGKFYSDFESGFWTFSGAVYITH